MAASDHTSNEQFIDIYHASEDGFTPPHVKDHPQSSVIVPYKKDVIFGGTEQAARDRVRATLRNGGTAALHHYRAPLAHVSPVVYADDAWAHLPQDQLVDGAHSAAERVGEHPSLWETVPVSPSQSRRSVLRYRNFVEDPGSISYIMHKDMINSGKIQYVGTQAIEGIK